MIRISPKPHYERIIILLFLLRFLCFHRLSGASSEDSNSIESQDNVSWGKRLHSGFHFWKRFASLGFSRTKSRPKNNSDPEVQLGDHRGTSLWGGISDPMASPTVCCNMSRQLHYGSAGALSHRTHDVLTSLCNVNIGAAIHLFFLDNDLHSALKLQEVHTL